LWGTLVRPEELSRPAKKSPKIVETAEKRQDEERVFQIFSINFKKLQDGENRGLWRLANEKGRYLWGPSV
jgi:hypothetical protein